MHPDLIQIEYTFSMAQAAAYKSRADALKTLMGKLPGPQEAPKKEERQMPLPFQGGQEATESQSLPISEGEAPPLLVALQVVIGDAPVSTVAQIYSALVRQGWLPLGSRDPLTYVRHTLSKNKDVFLRETRGRYTLGATNPYKAKPTLLGQYEPEAIEEEEGEEAEATPLSLSNPPEPSRPRHSREEIEMANQIVDQVLSMHRAAMVAPTPEASV